MDICSYITESYRMSSSKKTIQFMHLLITGDVNDENESFIVLEEPSESDKEEEDEVGFVCMHELNYFPVHNVRRTTLKYAMV